MTKATNKYKSTKFPNKENKLDNTIAGWMTSRPCDRCRKHRIRCNRDLKQCDHCKRHNIKCTYLDVPKKRGPKSKIDGYLDRYFHLASNVYQDSHDSNLSTSEEKTCDFDENSSSYNQPTDSKKSNNTQSDIENYLNSSQLYSVNSFLNNSSQFRPIFSNQLCQPIVYQQPPYNTARSHLPLHIMNSRLECLIGGKFEQMTNYNSYNNNTWLNIPGANYLQSLNYSLSPDYSSNLQ